MACTRDTLCLRVALPFTMKPAYSSFLAQRTNCPLNPGIGSRVCNGSNEECEERVRYANDKRTSMEYLYISAGFLISLEQ